MTSASETDFLVFFQSFEKMKSEDQDFIARLMEGVAAREKSDPKAKQMSPVDLFREVVQEIAPERVDRFNKWAAVCGVCR